MKRIGIGLACLFLFGGTAFVPVFAQNDIVEEEENIALSGGVETGIYSKYIWRGMELNDKGVFQPEAWLSLYDFEVEIWGNLDLTDTLGHKGKITEVDYSASYTYDFDLLSASLVYVYYDYPNTDEEKTQEIGVELEAGEDLQVGLEAYYDIDQAEGAYIKPSVGYCIDARDLLVTPSVGLGWASKKYNEYNFGAYKNSLVDLELTVKGEAELWNGIYLTMTVAYYSLLGSDLRKEVEEGKDGFWGGGSLGFAF